MLRRLAGTAGLLLLALVQTALGQSYASRKTDIRAGIVIIDSAQSGSGQPLNYTPHVWFNLDQDNGVKPAGWNIFNPRATTQVSPAVFARWSALGPAPTLGAGLTKASAPYWEVHLSQVGDDQLSQYDVLLLSAYGYTSLNSIERDKLRKFVDQGGTLWVDINSNTTFADNEVNTFPIPFQHNPNTSNPLLTNCDIFSDVLSRPYTLTLPALEQIRLDPLSFAAPVDLAAASMGAYWQMESWVETDYNMHFDSVVSSNNRPTVLVGKLGDGYMVVTTSEYAMALNRVGTGGGNYSFNNGINGLTPVYDRSTQTAAKFAVNLISLSSHYYQQGAGSRHASSNAIDVGPPLLMTTNVGDPDIQKNQGVVLYKGLMIVTSGNKVKVYDANPRTDLDGDGNFDDGIQDASLGNEYDELWESAPLPTLISAPACAEIPAAPNKDQIYVVGTDGTLYGFDAFDAGGGTINPSQSRNVGPIMTVAPPHAASFDPGDPNPGPFAPTIHDGLVYVCTVEDNPVTGNVWVVDPTTGSMVASNGGTWHVGVTINPTDPGVLPVPSGSPTIGYIPIQDNSGGFDRVMYIPGRPTNVMGPTGTASITSLWMAARGESPPPSSLVYQPNADGTTPTSVQITTRAGRQGLSVYCDNNVAASAYANRALGVKLTVIDANGNPFTGTMMRTYFNGNVIQTPGQPGNLSFGMNGLTLPAGTTFRLDYSIDWGDKTSNTDTPIIRGQLNLPDDYTDFPNGLDRRRIIGGIAMSPKGTIYCVTSTLRDTSNTQDCGSFYAIREDIGRGGFRLLTRYQLYPQHSIPLNQGEAQLHPGTLSDNDQIQAFLPAFMQGGNFNHLTYMGAPSVRNGVVYVAASGRKFNGNAQSSFIPYTVLMAFKAEPDPVQFHVGPRPDGFSLRQYDIDRSGNHSTPTVTNDMNQGQFSYDRNEGIIRIENLMTANRGVMVNAFSTSQPVILKQPNAPDELIEPDANGNSWSPLLWYTVVPGVQSVGGPVVTGTSVFVPGVSAIQSIDTYMNGGALTFSGMVEAFNSDIPPDSPWLIADASRPWNHQLYQMLFGPTGVSPSPNVLWPQLSTVRRFEDYEVAARQTALGRQSANVYSIAAGENGLAALGDKGAYAFARGDFLIADEGRLGRFDAAGNPLWIATTGVSTGSNDPGAVGLLKPLSRPVRAYSLGTNDILIADPGANRIARLDLSGREIRSITNFKLDPNNVPDGFEANEPLTLNSPRDVTMYTTYEVANAQSQMWNHFFIADTGNKRLIEIVDKYTVDANRQVTGTVDLGVLNWHSPSNFSGKDFDYNSVSRIWEPNSSRYYISAGIGGALPSRVDSGLDSPAQGNVLQQRESVSGNGGVVIFNPTDPSQNILINQVDVPDIPANAFWDYTTGTFNSLAQPGHKKPLMNVNSVTSRMIFDPAYGGSRVAIMFTDATGVYEIVQPVANGDWVVRWMLPNEAFRNLRHVFNSPPEPENAMDLRATYARRMEDGDVIVVNGYLGKTRGDSSTLPTDYNGEVLQLYGEIDNSRGSNGFPGAFSFNKPNLGFEYRSIVFQLPPIIGARGLVLPVFADRR